MVRKALYVALPYALGFLCSSVMYGEVSLVWVVISALVGALTLKLAFKFEFKQSVLCGTTFLIGFMWYANYVVSTVERVESFSEQYVNFSGRVVETNDYSGDMSSYIVDGSINGEVKTKLYLYVNTIDGCDYGDTLTFECTPIEVTNSYVFSSKDYYSSKGVYLETYEISNVEVTQNFDLKSRVVRAFNAYRESIVSIFKMGMSKKGSSLLSAMLFGDKSDMSKADKDILTRSGISHLVAVSGFHLAIFASMLELLLKRLDMPKVLNFLLYLTFASMFVALVGFPISAVRTLIMLTISKSATLFFRRSDVLNTLSLTILVMLSLEPYLIHNTSFLLSVCGVFGIGVFSRYILEGTKFHGFVNGVLATVFTTLCTFPVAMCYFDEVSIMSPVSNVLCLPLCEVSMYSGFVIFLTGGKLYWLNKVLLTVSDISCRAMLALCNSFAKVSFGNVPNSYDTIKYVTIAVVILSAMCYGMFKNKKLLLKVVVLGVVTVSMVTSAVRLYESDKVKVSVLGTSKYEVMVISYKSSVDVIDFSKNYRTAKYVRKYCKSMGYSEIRSVSFLKRGYQTMAMYDTLLKNVTVDSVNVPKGTYFREGQRLLSNTPNCVNIDSESVYTYDYGDFNITVHSDGSFETTLGGTTQTFSTEQLNVTFEFNLNGIFCVRDLGL